MDPMTNNRLLVGTFFLACATIAWTDIKKNSIVTPPYRFIGAAMVYGILSALTPVLGPAASLLGIGYYIVLLYQYFGGDLTTEAARSIGGLAGPAIGGLAGPATDLQQVEPDQPPTPLRWATK